MKLERLLMHLSSIHSISIFVYHISPDGQPVFHAAFPDDPNTAVPAPILELMTKTASSRIPALASIQNTRYYAVIPLGETCVLVGPTALSAALPLSNTYAVTELQPGQNHIMDVTAFLGIVSLIAEEGTGRLWTNDELLSLNEKKDPAQEVIQQFSEKLYEDRENGNRHNAYSQEVRMLKSIEAGDLDMLRQAQQEQAGGRIGVMAPQMERSVRNVCIGVITLISRAAIRGGVMPEAAFTMCDAYAIKIEELTDLMELPALIHGAQVNFATMVRVATQEQNKPSGKDEPAIQHPLVERCKNYVYNHLHGKVSLTEAAEALHTTPNYLSGLFKRTEGITFSDFVVREKVGIAKSLLIYSPLSYAMIAATLGFASQSHMGKCFRQWTGMTPIQFRKQYAMTET